MAKSTIEWTNASWNPLAGCSLVSEGCRNCYAMTMAARLEAMGQEKYEGLTERRGGKTIWTGQINVDQGMIRRPLEWKKPQMVFVNSMSDLFHEEAPEEAIIRIWNTMKEASWHTFQVLTKRPERMERLVKDLNLKTLPNLWLGTSIENRAVLDRIEPLRKTPAAVRFISFEPLIGSVGEADLSGIDWVIVGGESGPGARPMLESWVDEIHDAALRHDVPFFFKQWGGVRKKENGREYKGREWDEMPAAPAKLTTAAEG